MVKERPLNFNLRFDACALFVCARADCVGESRLMSSAQGACLRWVGGAARIKIIEGIATDVIAVGFKEDARKALFFSGLLHFLDG